MHRGNAKKQEKTSSWKDNRDAKITKKNKLGRLVNFGKRYISWSLVIVTHWGLESVAMFGILLFYFYLHLNNIFSCHLSRILKFFFACIFCVDKYHKSSCKWVKLLLIMDNYLFLEVLIHKTEKQVIREDQYDQLF